MTPDEERYLRSIHRPRLPENDPLDDRWFLDGIDHLRAFDGLTAIHRERARRMDKSDPLNQSTIADQVREEMAKRTLWLNAANFEQMVEASYDGFIGAKQVSPEEQPTLGQWHAMCAAALAVVEWRLGGRVRP